MKRTMMLMMVAVMAAPALATATDKGIRRTYGGDWLAKHRAAADRQKGADTSQSVEPTVARDVAPVDR